MLQTTILSLCLGTLTLATAIGSKQIEDWTKTTIKADRQMADFAESYSSSLKRISELNTSLVYIRNGCGVLSVLWPPTLLKAQKAARFIALSQEVIWGSLRFKALAFGLKSQSFVSWKPPHRSQSLPPCFTKEPLAWKDNHVLRAFNKHAGLEIKLAKNPSWFFAHPRKL